jgi:dihydroorotase
MLDRLVRAGELTIGQLVERLAIHPRRILGLDPVVLAAGSPADLTVLDLEEPVTFTPDYYVSKSKNSAFMDQTAIGRPTDVLVKGYWAMRDKEVA